MKWFWKICFLVFAVKAGAQPRGKVEYYSTEQGLSDQRITTMLKDREGFMWFGTWDGINRFDGHSFVSFKSAPRDKYQIGNERIDQIVEDRAGHLWILAYDGEVYQFDKRKEVFFPLSAMLNAGGKVTFRSILAAADGLVWLKSAEKGLFCVSQTDLSPGRFQQFYSAAPGRCRLPSDGINFLFADSNHRIWVGTSRGLCCLKRLASGDFVNSGIVPADVATQSNLTAFDEDAERLYFSTDDGRLIVFQKKTGRFSVRRLTTGPLHSICRSKKSNVLYAAGSDGELIVAGLADRKITTVRYKTPEQFNTLYEDGTGAVWIEPEKAGAIRFDPATRSFRLFSFDRGEGLLFIGNRYHVLEDNSGTVWVNMKGGGFGYFNPLTKKIEYVLGTPDGANYNLPPIVFGVYYDSNGILWLQTSERDLVKIVLQANNFKQLLLTTQAASPSDNEVRGILYDRENRLWLGAKKSDLFIYRNNERLKGVLINPPPDGLKMVYAMLEDRRGNIWLGTKGNGLFKAMPADRERTRYRLTHFLPVCKEIYALLEDRQGRIWMGSYDNGLTLIEDEGGGTEFIHGGAVFRNYPERSFQKIRHLALDTAGNLWIGTTNGLLVQGVEKDRSGAYRYKTYSNTSVEKERLSNNDIQFIHRDRKGRMWLATSGGGFSLARGNRPLQSLEFRNYTTRDGMPNDYVLGCAEDKRGDFWLSTENGIVRFNPETRVIRNYDPYDGLPKVAYSEASVCTNAVGSEIVFGTRHGYITFDPERINPVRTEAKLALTNLQINNEDAGPGKNESVLSEDINYVFEVALKYNQNTISIDYEVLDQRAGSRQAFAYRLIGFDSTWHNDRRFRRTTYTNLPPGDYVFEVKALSPDLYTNQPYRRLSIVILPPWWKTWWAYVLYVVAAGVLLYFFRRNAADKMRLRSKIAVEKRLAELKMNFFTNVSHELRTPLTLIVNPLERLARKGDLSREEAEWVAIARRNADRTVRFINQLLDLRKVQSDKAVLRVSRVEVIDLVKMVGEHFSEAARSKGIDIRIRSDRREVFAWVDAEKLDVVVYNLLGNAIKFSPEGKGISVVVRAEGGDFFISVRDEGAGVPEESLEEIFELFREVGPANGREITGTGIGLALCREFVELHGGRIWAENNRDGGLTITVKLRCGEEPGGVPVRCGAGGNGAVAMDNAAGNGGAGMDNADDNGGSGMDNAAGNGGSGMDNAAAAKDLPSNGGPKDEDCIRGAEPGVPLVLLVEDNEELRRFIEGQLKEHFRVMTAGNGEEGLRMANELGPDLVVSDIMMPKMDGIQLLDRIKNDEGTSHIPVILLSARHSIESQIEGLRYGADHYITKPFDSEFLIVAIHNLIRQRKKLFEALVKRTRPVESIAEPIVITSRDQSFLKQVIEVVEGRMADTDFNIDVVAESLAMSQKTFYRKFKSLTGLTPVEFVREMRMQRAKQLLDGGGNNISEVAYHVGFSNPKYFSTCFKEKFHVSPSEYVRVNNV